MRSWLAGLVTAILTGLLGPAAMSVRLPMIVESGPVWWASVLIFTLVAGLLWHIVRRSRFRVLIAPLAGAACGVAGVVLVWGAWMTHADMAGPPVHDPHDPWKLSHWEAFHFLGFLAALDVVPVLAALWGVGGVTAWAWTSYRKTGGGIGRDGR